MSALSSPPSIVAPRPVGLEADLGPGAEVDAPQKSVIRAAVLVDRELFTFY